MKDIKEVSVKELKEVVKELNESGLIDKKIKLVGISNLNLLKEFTTAIEGVTEKDESVEIPQGIADFYNDLYADEIDESADDDSDTTDDSEDVDDDDDTDAESEDADGDEAESDTDTDEEEEQSDDEEADDDDSADDDDAGGSAEEEEDSSDVEEPDDVPAPKAVAKKEKKNPVIRDKKEKKVMGVEKRAAINPKYSLVKKVTNLLNFGDQRYKQTTYFPLDCETIRILETNVGLYPSEILAQMKADKKVAKKIEKFTESVLNREINKVKSCYSYIVGAIREDKADGKLRHVMTDLLAGKEVPPETAHYTTVKIARRALLAYLDVTGVDYSVMKDTRRALVKKASEKKDKPVEKVAPKPEPKPEPKTKPAPKAEPKAKGKPAPKKSPKK